MDGMKEVIGIRTWIMIENSRGKPHRQSDGGKRTHGSVRDVC